MLEQLNTKTAICVDYPRSLGLNATYDAVFCKYYSDMDILAIYWNLQKVLLVKWLHILKYMYVHIIAQYLSCSSVFQISHLQCTTIGTCWTFESVSMAFQKSIIHQALSGMPLSGHVKNGTVEWVCALYHQPWKVRFSRVCGYFYITLNKIAIQRIAEKNIGKC